MNLKDFYFAIKSKKDTDDFELVEQYLNQPQSFAARPVSWHTLHYLKAFLKNPSKKLMVNWNWAAFLNFRYWSAYRRMYWIPFFIECLLWAPELILLAAGGSFNLSLVSRFGTIGVSVFAWLMLSMFGDSLYLRAVERRFQSGKTSPPSVVSILVYLFIQVFITCAPSVLVYLYINYFYINL
jgi:hypothetical protein